MLEVERAEKRILQLLNKRDLSPSKILDQLADSFDEITIRKALLNLVTRQEARWISGRRLARRHDELVHG